MKTLTIEIPDSVNLDENEARNLLAAKLYENGSLSLGQAADLAGHSKRAFMELLGNYGVSIFNYSETELENDILNAQSYHL
ncbi:MAG: UPF0175 family protein [Ginsengibacter sp.]